MDDTIIMTVPPSRIVERIKCDTAKALHRVWHIVSFRKIKVLVMDGT